LHAIQKEGRLLLGLLLFLGNFFLGFFCHDPFSLKKSHEKETQQRFQLELMEQSISSPLNADSLGISKQLWVSREH